MGTISITQFSNGTTADANQVNADLNAIGNVINGNLDDTNISASAGINGSKLLAGSIPTTALLNVDGWIPSAESWAYGANNGNKEYTVTVAGDKTGKYSPGMKVKLPRTVTPPTQAMSFVAASSQYASKTAPTGTTITTTYTYEAFIYLNSYTAGNQGIITQWNATNGLINYITTAGQLAVQSGTGGANTTYQSVPLRRWVHVAASYSSGTVVHYINGTIVPSTGSPTTTVTSAGNLQVGALNSSSFFDGCISEARLWNSVRTQAQIQANMNINLVGNETNLVALFQGNGNFNDANANGNSLTAVGGASFATATNPYNAIEYGIITKAAYANPTTTLTLFTGTDNNIPNQTLGSPSYSLQRTPYGFQADTSKWRVETLLRANTPVAFGALNLWTSITGAVLVIPTGGWRIGWQGIVFLSSSVAGARNGDFLMFTGTPNNSADRTNALTAEIYSNGVSTQSWFQTVSLSTNVNLATGSTYQMYGDVVSATGAETGGLADRTPFTMYAEYTGL